VRARILGPTTATYNTIMDQIKHINSTLEYQPIGGLIELVRRKKDQIEQMHLTKLNDNRKLETRAALLEQ